MPDSSKPDLFLYHTVGCHLCEDAETIIRPLARQLHLRYLNVDIADDDSLVELYGIRIPVLHHCQTGRELGWPFDDESVLRFLNQCTQA